LIPIAGDDQGLVVLAHTVHHARQIGACGAVSHGIHGGGPVHLLVQLYQLMTLLIGGAEEAFSLEFRLQ
jgi:hypothetical protein